MLSAPLGSALAWTLVARLSTRGEAWCNHAVQWLIYDFSVRTGMLIPGNIPNIVAAGTLRIRASAWARIGIPMGLVFLDLLCATRAREMSSFSSRSIEVVGQAVARGMGSGHSL